MNEFNSYFYAGITDVKIDKGTWETSIATPYNATNANIEPLFHLSCGFDFNVETKDAKIDKSTWQALVGSSSNDFSIMYDEVVLVPVKRNKKRRIQKKWIKRYGYKEIRVPRVIDGVGIEQISNNEFMFVKENNDND